MTFQVAVSIFDCAILAQTYPIIDLCAATPYVLKTFAKFDGIRAQYLSLKDGEPLGGRGDRLLGTTS